MKNIILLPTDNATRLHNTFNEFRLERGFDFSPYNLNMYITSENKIKLDEPYLGEDNNIYYLCEGGINYNGKKIILTTDQTLIDNVIQPIDEEFLQWYANNGSCEFVEIEEYNSFGVDNWRYLIVFPQDLGKKHNHEGKALTSEEVMEGRSSAYEFIDFKVSPEKEALEEAAFKYVSGKSVKNIYSMSDFINGVKWREEKTYTEEEVKLLLLERDRLNHSYKYGYIPDLTPVREWFENNKK